MNEINGYCNKCETETGWHIDHVVKVEHIIGSEPRTIIGHCLVCNECGKYISISNWDLFQRHHKKLNQLEE